MVEPASFPAPFGRYQLLERIAVGGMAEIFRARQTGSHGFSKVIVIKRILAHLAADPSFLDMFIDEAKLTVHLVHPKIVQVLEFGEVEGHYYIALELVDGFDALALLRLCAIRKVRLPAPLAVWITHEILDALDYAHRATDDAGTPLGIIHRDISPSNIFISRRGDVKLGDFGIARAAERQGKTQTGTLKGKYGYMSPEQVVGQPMDGRSDVFAVGIVLAELLMGRRLFTAPNELDVLLMVRDVKLDRLVKYGGELPAPLRAVLHRAMQREPAARFQSAAAMRDDLADQLFSTGQRVGAPDLGAFIKRLQDEDELGSAPTRAAAAAPPQELLVGPETRAAEQEALALRDQMRREAERARAAATSGEAPLGAAGVVVDLGDDDPTPRLDTSTRPRPLSDAALAAELSRPPSTARPASSSGLSAIEVSFPAPPPLAPRGSASRSGTLPAPASGVASRSGALPAAAGSASRSGALPAAAGSASRSGALPVAAGSASRSGALPAGASSASRSGSLPVAPPAQEPSGAAPRPPARPAPLASPTSGPHLEGDLAVQTPARLFSRLAVERETGLAILDCGAIRKDVYLVDGAPEYVTSNVASELLGEYLVAKGIISSGELSMALAMMPRFGGKLGDTLVGLSLLRPLDLFRHLSQQVRDKLIDVFGWGKGHFRFHRGEVNQREAFPLGLDGFEIVGAGVAAIPAAAIVARFQPFSSAVPRAAREPRMSPELFRIANLREVLARLDGRHALGALLAAEPAERRVSLLRAVYLLLESDLATLD